MHPQNPRPLLIRKVPHPHGSHTGPRQFILLARSLAYHAPVDRTLLLPMNFSWTTAAGWASGFAVAVLSAIATGMIDPATIPTWGKIVLVGISGVAPATLGQKARDWNRTSEQEGLK